MIATNVTYPTLSDEDLLEMEKRFTRMDNPRLIVEVRALRLSLAEETAKHILTIESSADIFRQLVELRETHKSTVWMLEQDREQLAKSVSEVNALRRELAEAKDEIKRLNSETDLDQAIINTLSPKDNGRFA